MYFRPSSLLLPPRRLWQHRSLLFQLTKREVTGRYRGSFLGLIWSLLTPLLMLSVYTFVFSVVFKVRWGEQPAGRLDFALMVFTGMTLFLLFAETVSRAPRIILDNANYVKRVVFPLEVLPLTALGAALFHAHVGLLILIAFVVFKYGFAMSLFSLPLIMAPLILFMAGLTWALAAIGVYFRDLAQTIGLVVSVLQFMSPVFYPISAVPAQFRDWLLLSPLTFPIEQLRLILLVGNWPDWGSLLAFTLFSTAVCAAGLGLFSVSRKGFADVL